MIFTGIEASDLWVSDGSHKNVDIPIEEKRVIAKFTDLKHTISPAQEISIVHGYLKHAGTA